MDASKLLGGSVPLRIQKMKERILSSPIMPDLERAKWVTKVYKETEGKPIGPAMRAALAIQETFRNYPIWIDEDEVLVGHISSKKGVLGQPVYVEMSIYLNEILIPYYFYRSEEKLKEAFPEGIGSLSPEALKWYTRISEEEYKLLKEEIVPYWKDRTIGALMRKEWEKAGLLGEPLKEKRETFLGAMQTTYDLLAPVVPMQGHTIIGLKKVLQLGFNGIIEQARRQLEKFKRDFEEGRISKEAYEKAEDFLRAVEVSAQAVIEFAERYAKLAEEMASKADGERRKVLLEIAERMRHVPANPPRNFIEALLARWFTQVAIAIAHAGNQLIIGPGRVDQLLYPYYKQDIEAGRLTPDQALELIMEYLCKLATFLDAGPNVVTIGGVDRNGEDAVNDVSYLFLEAFKRLKGCGRDGLAVRIHPEKTPREFVLKAAEVLRTTAGLAFYNDKTIIKDLMADGYSLEDARDYAVVGCVELTGAGNSIGYTSGQAVRLPQVLEATLFGGRLSAAGWKLVGAPTPPATEFKSFEDVKKAFVEQLSYAIDLMIRRTELKDKVIAENYPLPLFSATIEGCIESGKDVTWGGARYNHATISAQALATVANSLAAIKWAVFDNKLLTMEQLLELLKSNFEGAEEIRQMLWRKAPKYGNDDPYVDEIAQWVADVMVQEGRKRKFWMGGTWRVLFVSVSGSQLFEGKYLGATPDGRKAGEPVSNGIAPVEGTQMNGLTAVLRSAARIGIPTVSSGTSLTLNINPANIKDEEGLEKFASLILAYFMLGGRHVQFNPISKEILLDAQKHPEKYPDLVVKVTGYSWRFIDLPKKLQDEIIARLEYEVT